MNRVDVLILTALSDELDAVLALRGGFSDARDESGALYHVIELETARKRPLRVAAAWLGGMGETTAALRATSLVRELDPACLAMCGICAGKRGAVSLGDVIVADRVYAYDHGKLIAGEGEREGAFLHDLETYSLDKAWHDDASRFARDVGFAKDLSRERPIARATQERWLLHALAAHEAEGAPFPTTNPERKRRCPDWSSVIEALKNKGLVVFEGKTLRLSDAGRARVHEEQIHYPDGLPEEPPLRVHVGPIATGKVVREDPGIFDRLSRLVRKTIGVEMEAAAIGQVAAHLGRRAIVVKAVSDHADHDKDDSFRTFACLASASWLLSFLERFFEPAAASQDPFGALADDLERAFERRGKLRSAKVDTKVVDAEILELKRKLREGGHLRAGDSLGDRRYLLIEQVGRGGFGYVWRALDRETNVEVAIKVLHGVVAGDPSRRERFFRGARIMAEITHEAVVRVIEPHGEDVGFHYFVMELVPGRDLRQAVLLGELRGEAALPAILSVGEALALAHSKKIVHRDVKPANILIATSGSPKITDFDLVVAHDTTGGTKSGALGTWIYAAPECMHHPQNATPRADVYGLSMSAVFALYGQELPPDVMRNAARFIDRLTCTPAIKAVLKKGTSWDADERFSDAGEFCRALAEALRPEPEEEPAPHTIRSTLALEELEAAISSAEASAKEAASTALPEQPDDVLSVAIDAEGQLVAVGHRDGTIRLWDVATGQCVNALWTGNAPILSTCFAPHAPFVATLSTDGQIAVWDTSTGDLQNRFKFRNAMASSIAFSPSGTTLAAGLSNGDVRVVSLDPTEVSAPLSLGWKAQANDPIGYVAFTPDGHSLVSCTTSGQIMRTTASLSVRMQRDLAKAVSCAALSPDGKFIAAATVGEILVAPLGETESAPRSIALPDAGKPCGLAFGFDGGRSRLVCAAMSHPGASSTVVLDRFRAASLTTPLALPRRVVVTSIAASYHCHLLALGTRGGCVFIVDPRTRETMGQLHPSQ